MKDNDPNKTQKRTPVTPKVQYWLDRLCDAERNTFAQVETAFNHLNGDQWEQMAIATAQDIMHQRIIAGKCDACERVEGCMLTPAMRKGCDGPFIGQWQDANDENKKNKTRIT